MPLLTDAVIRKCYHNALANWRYTGYVRFKDVAAEWLAREVGCTQKDLARLMYEYVAAGGDIEQQPETRPE